MAYLGKTYKFEKEEKFDEFLSSMGVAKGTQDAILSYSPSVTLVKDGDSYTFTTDGPNGPKQLTFKSGVEFDLKVGTHDVKVTNTVDGNVLVQTSKFPSGRTSTVKWEYSGNKLVVASTNSEWNGVAYGYYSA